MKQMRIVYLALVGLLVSSVALGQTITSAQLGAWNNTATWVGGVIPTNANSTTVQINHSVNVPNSFNATAVGINIGSTGTLTIDGGTPGGSLSFTGVLTNVGIFPPAASRLVINGTLIVEQGASISPGTNPGKVIVNSGGIYRHNYTTSAGTIYQATWNAGSELEITGYTSNTAQPGGLNQNFRNVEWNCASSTGTVLLDGTTLTNILGNFVVTSTNFTGLSLTTNNNTTLTIGGNFDVNDYVALSFGSGNASVNVKGDLILSLADAIGNYGSGTTAINFNGTGTQTLTAINPNSTAVDFTVINGSSLSIPNGNFLSGAGSVTLQAGSTLLVGDQNGITTTSSSGAIQVSGSRNYLAGANFVYNGVTQNLGDEWSASGSLNGIAVNLELTSGTVVTNNNIGSTSLVGVLTLTNGRLNIGNSNTLTIQGIFNSTTNGYIGGSATSNLTFTGSGTMGTLNFAPAANNLNTLTVGRPGNLVLGTDLTVNTINLSFGNLNFNNHTLTVNGASITSAGTGLISNSSSNLVFGGSTFSGSVPFSGASNQLNNLTFATPGGVFNWNSNVTILNRVILSAGTINHTSGLTMGSSSTFSRSGGSVLVSSPDVVTRYSVEYTGGVTTGLELPGTTNELNNLIVNSSGAVTLDKDITVNGNVDLLGSTFGANGFDVTLTSPSGTWTRNGGGFAGGSGILTIAGNIIIVAPSSPPNYTNITVNNGASLTFPVGALNIGGNIVNNGTINPGTSTTNFNGNTTISGSSTTTFNNIVINGSGTLTAPSATPLGIAGNFLNTGTFNHNNGTVVFSGTTAIVGTSASNFFHVNITGTLTGPTILPLGIAGDLTNNGTFNHNNGTIFFTGTVAAQTVSGSALVVNNIRVSNPISPGVRINNTVRLNGVCTLLPGAYFSAQGTGSGVFIISSSSQTAGGRIAALPNPNNFTGQVTVERYVHGKTGGDYRYISMPITTNANVGVWRNSMYVTGNFSDRSTNADNANINNAGNTNPSVYTYNSATQAYVGVSGGGGLTTATAVSSRVGYSVYDFNNGPVTIAYRGLLEKGDVPITISGTAGRYNLVPNPYPSPIDWENVTKTNVTDAMYLRIDNNVYTSYVGGVATNPPFVGWSGEIATGQAFFVVSSGSGSTFTLNEASKSNNAFYFLREQSPRDYFRIKVQSSNDAYDEVVIRFAEDATDQFDPDYDAPKMWNGGELFPFSATNPYVNMAAYLSAPEDAYSINTIGLLTEAKIVRLTVSDLAAGKNTLTFTDLDKLTKSYNIVLVDNYLKYEYDVADGYEHEFIVDDNAQSSGSTRFHLRINGTKASNLITANEGELFGGAKIYPNPVIDKLNIELSAAQESSLKSIELVSMLGVPVVHSERNKELLNPGIKTIDMSGLSGGVYLLNIRCGETVRTIRVLKK